jgi:hypothetical protein
VPVFLMTFFGVGGPVGGMLPHYLSAILVDRLGVPVNQLLALLWLVARIIEPTLKPLKYDSIPLYVPAFAGW